MENFFNFLCVCLLEIMLLLLMMTVILHKIVVVLFFLGRASAIMKVSSEYLSKIRVRFKICRQRRRPPTTTTTTTTRLRLMTTLLLILLLPRSLSAQGNTKGFDLYSTYIVVARSSCWPVGKHLEPGIDGWTGDEVINIHLILLVFYRPKRLRRFYRLGRGRYFVGRHQNNFIHQ